MNRDKLWASLAITLLICVAIIVLIRFIMWLCDLGFGWIALVIFGIICIWIVIYGALSD